MLTDNYSIKSGVGGAVYAEFGFLTLSKSNCTRNRAGNSGGAISVTQSSFDCSESIFINNSAKVNGGAIHCRNSSINLSDTYFTNNVADYFGGAMFISQSISNGMKAHYINNSAQSGGAVYIKQGKASSSDSSYLNNYCRNNGGAMTVVEGTVDIYHSSYVNNRATMGGAAYTIKGNVFISHCQYFLNRAKYGGAISADVSNISSYYSIFTDNHAVVFGGAINGNESCVYSANCTYTNNSAIYGGAAYIMDGNISVVSSNYQRNTAMQNGGAIFAYRALVFKSLYSQFSSNRAFVSGGAIFSRQGACSVFYSIFENNNAKFGGALCNSKESNITCISSYLSNNAATEHGGAIYSNSESMASYLFTSSSHFVNNKAGGSGGAIAIELGHISILDGHFKENSATNGGVIIVVNGSIVTNHSLYSNNKAIEHGGVFFLQRNSMYSFNSSYTNNSAVRGGVLYILHGYVSTLHSNYTNNGAYTGGVMYISCNLDSVCTVLNIGNYYISNTALNGAGVIFASLANLVDYSNNYLNNFAKSNSAGAVYLENCSYSIMSTSFVGNTAFAGSGGAIFVDTATSLLLMTATNFVSNHAAASGGIFIGLGNTTIINCYFKDNSGGAIQIEDEGTIYTSGSLYLNNTSYRGGALSTYRNSVILNCFFLNNTANYGGAVYSHFGSVSSNNCSFIANKANYAGAVYGFKESEILSLDCQYTDNVAFISGGAICSIGGTITITNTTLTNNTGDSSGGAIYLHGGNLYCFDTQFLGNQAVKAGGAVMGVSSNLYSSNCQYTNNHAGVFGGAIYVDSCPNPFPINITNGEIETIALNLMTLACGPNDNSTVKSLKLINSTAFVNNTCGLVGGAVTATRGEILIDGSITVISGNAASYGSGVGLIQSTLNIHSPIKILCNTAKLSGGGIYAYLSEVYFASIETCTIRGNVAAHYGGGMFVIDTSMEFTHGTVNFESNKASLGGAVHIKGHSSLNILKTEQEKAAGEFKIHLAFLRNHAQYGGAIYVDDKSRNKQACAANVPGTQEVYRLCFMQSLLLNGSDKVKVDPTNFINIFFTNNTASSSGDVIYGGLLDRCVLNSSAELVRVFPEHATFTGFDYVRATSEFYGLVDYDNLTSSYDPDKLINAISRSEIIGLISSEPLQVCFCLKNLPNCSYHHQRVSTKKGQLFHLSVVAVDQVGNTKNSTVVSVFISNNGDLNVDQVRQDTFSECTDLEYNVYPKGNSKSTQLELYADGPCTDIGVSKRILEVIFPRCTCPVGFHPVETETLCRCECDPKLRSYILGCSYQNETILLDTNAWIDYVNTSTGSGYIIYDHCPFDYCVQEPVNVNLNVQNGADDQCSFNRSGKLCGACKENLSLAMGSSRCMECSNNFLSLILPFTLAGVVLVAFILILNLTVATGTLHGLIFYANILAASRLAFIPSSSPVILNILISWINLDLGFETCFYDGMDSYRKILLQLAFPVYIILLSALIIVISEYSIRFAMILGRKDPVATLSTLILLSYSKLIRTIVVSLQYTYLDYPDGSREIVWLYDANVPYFKPSHIPRFIIASIIIVSGSAYTVLLFFGQWIPRCENRFVRWANNPKYNAFIIKYHAPFNPKHRYWMGLLLFARILHYVVAAFVSEPAILLSVICIVLCLFLFKVAIARRGYKNWSLNTLESSFLLNLGIFAAVTYYLSEHTEVNQTSLAGVSLAVAFLTFVIILFYHFYAYILKGTCLWNKITQLWQQINNARNQRPYQPLPAIEPEDEEENIQDIEMHPPNINDGDDEPIDLPREYDPPVITPAVRYSQERRELDVLDPITDNDYQQVNQHPAPRPRQAPTYTVVDIVRHASNED